MNLFNVAKFIHLLHSRGLLFMRLIVTYGDKFNELLLVIKMLL